MPKIELYSASLTKSHLLRLTDEERHFFFLITHFSNEIGLLSKACLYTNNSIPDEPKLDDVEYQAAIAQFYFWTRTLAGKLYEGWQLIQVNYFPTALSKNYSAHPDFRAALDELKQYFSRGNSLLELIRNNYAFHSADGDKKLMGTIDNFSDSHKFMFYDSQSVGGRFHLGPEEVIIQSIRSEYIARHNGKLFDHFDLIKEILRVTSIFNKFTNEYFNICVEKIFSGDDKGAKESIGTVIVNAQELDEIKFPYFSTKSDLVKQN